MSDFVACFIFMVEVDYRYIDTSSSAVVTKMLLSLSYLLLLLVVVCAHNTR